MNTVAYTLAESTSRVHCVNLWRTLRGELKLQSYTLESCAHAVLRRRLPCFPADSGAVGSRRRLGHRSRRRHRASALACNTPRDFSIEHHREDDGAIDLVARTRAGSNLRHRLLLGAVQGQSVQGRVHVAATLQNYVLISPNKEQVARQPAMECLQLVMEPESKMYDDPVAVLDFQSLYPSMVIAYNLCYSTCMGRVPRDVEQRWMLHRRATGLGLGPGPPPSSALQSSRYLAAYSRRSSTATDRKLRPGDLCTQRRHVYSLGSTRCPAAAPHRDFGHTCDGQAGAEAGTRRPARAARH